MFELKLLKIIKLSVMVMIILPFSCNTVSHQQSESPSIIFPYKWVGNIDKINSMSHLEFVGILNVKPCFLLETREIYAKSNLMEH